MRCHWSTRANNLLQGITHRDIASPFGRISRPTIHAQLTNSYKTAIKPPSSYHNHINTFIRGRRRLCSFVHTSTKVASASAGPNKSMTMSAPLTDSGISRAAAKAVRMCIRAGEIADAYYVINSLLSSTNVTPPHKIGLARHIRVPHRGFIPLQFSPTISPRLAAHSLLHGLLRVGLIKKAYQLTEALMDCGVKIQPRSLDAVMDGLLNQGATPPGFLE